MKFFTLSLKKNGKACNLQVIHVYIFEGQDARLLHCWTGI